MSNAYRDWRKDVEADRPRALTAAYCCSVCGELWGTGQGGVYTVHNGQCNVCLARDVAVWPVRAYGYLKKARG